MLFLAARKQPVPWCQSFYVREAALTIWLDRTMLWRGKDGFLLPSSLLPGPCKARRVQFHTLSIISKGSRMLNTRKRWPDPHCSSFKADTGRLLTGQTINKLITSAAKVGAAGQQMRKNVLSSWDWHTVGTKSLIWKKLHKNEDWSIRKL